MDASSTNATPDSLALGACRFDRQCRELLDARGSPVPLRRQCLDVLAELARQPGRLVSKSELMRAVWPHVVVTDDSLVQCITAIRRALHDARHLLLRTETSRGYRLVPSLAPLVEAAPPFEQHIGQALSRDGLHIAWARSGAGRPLVRVAHWMTHLDEDWRSACFGPRIRALSAGCELIRYDGRGCGRSQRPADPGGLDEWLADLEAVVDAAGLERFALLGPSGGAATAIRYARRHPERVERLILLGGYARGGVHRGVSAAHLEAFCRLIEDGWAQDNAAYRQLITSQLWPGASAAQMTDFNRLQQLACDGHTAAALMRRQQEVDVSAELAGLRCQTLLLHSPRDARVPYEEARRIAAALHAARLQPFDSPNHTPMAEEPAFHTVVDAILAFLQRGAQRRPAAARPAATSSRLAA